MLIDEVLFLSVIQIFVEEVLSFDPLGPIDGLVNFGQNLLS